MYDQIGFIGLGLIGGSIAKAIKKYNLAKKLIAYDIDKSSIALAYEEKVIDYCAPKIDESFKDCSIIFLCCPVNFNINAYKKLIPIVNSNCIITDVGSTKEKIIEAINELSMPIPFIGGHPMAGSEKIGYSASTPHLFENAYYILTPPSENKKDKNIQKLFELIQKIKALPIIISPKLHDLVVAIVSHAPHIIAASLVNMVKNLDTDNSYLHTLAAGGFKDITRIASSSPLMWQQISITNKDNIIMALEYYIAELKRITSYIKDKEDNKIYNFFEEARTYRESFQEKNYGGLIPSYSIAVDVVDEPGIIAKIAALLAKYNISIKNIGIINNREFTEGVLEIVFYDNDSLEKSVDILKEEQYIVYKR